VDFGAEAAKNDAYKANRLDHQDWDIIAQSVAVLQASAQATKHLEGTTFPTISLVLPYVYRLLKLSSPDGMLWLSWKPQGQQWLRMNQINLGVRKAREAFHNDLERRFVTDMPSVQRAELDIATLLDPRFKTW